MTVIYRQLCARKYLRNKPGTPPPTRAVRRVPRKRQSLFVFNLDPPKSFLQWAVSMATSRPTRSGGCLGYAAEGRRPRDRSAAGGALTPPHEQFQGLESGLL